eukprot:COSAG01_NODE_25670_length_737_cov_1.564263_2_plen_54_part_01
MLGARGALHYRPAYTLSSRRLITHPTRPRHSHACSSHYEIRPVGPPLVGGGGGA